MAKRTIFITGAASGIGRATARLFHEKGWFVGLYDIDDDGLERVAAELGGEGVIHGHLDVTDNDLWRRAVAQFGEATRGCMHVFFNNAGIARIGLFEDVPVEASRAVIETNLMGAVYGIHACLPLLKATPGACIVNASSVFALGGGPYAAAYATSKFGIRGLTETLSIEFEHIGVRVCDVMPWFIDTPMLEESPVHGVESDLNPKETLRAAGEPVYQPEDVARTVWKAIGGRRTHYLVGGKTYVVSFLVRFLPGLARTGQRQMLGKFRKLAGKA